MSLDHDPEPDTLLRIVWETLSIDLARDFIGNVMGQGANRMLQIYQLLIEVKPLPNTLAFLRKISRCFIWAFDEEAMILCRGAIDTAFTNAVTNKMCARFEEPAAPFGFTLAQRIRIAGKLGIVNPAEAKWINKHATSLAHESPLSGENTLHLIRGTLNVIQSLTSS